ncbi:hypothetical protein F5B22DRAFT_647609 [Xylaria bambusicola]|uniref:uncharacterized protein n=1 Tax=Xylaria bambusicola TaxID=326684 RepID=UPI0020088502|nr:uncharacterized protein F5B22DRAFT_647609 [Xylaria bambusicola]KAI0514570.1 hypothetical protein F5B22DRAFT_647609 [Xylaria bambusicola]
MSTTSSSTSGSRPTSRHQPYDTGFPDFFASCTTSMRHPEAVIEPGFAMSAEHIDPSKSLHRSRKTLLRKHRRTISHGKITEEELAQLALERRISEASSTTKQADSKSYDSNANLTQSSNAGAESPSRAKETRSIMGLTPGFQYANDEAHDDDERRKSNIFRKLINKT